MFWDTHCHIFHEYYDDIKTVIKNANENGVDHFITSGCDKKSNEEVLNLIATYDSIYGVIGIHPEEMDSFQENDFLFLKQHLNDSKIIGIGEIGLDYHYTKENKEKQKEVFERQLELAEEYHLPVVIHSRDATEDTIKVLKKYKVKGIIHSFSGSQEVAEIYIKMGFKLGINGVVTFKNCKIKDILPKILSHIVLETDSPYLTPHPYRGTKNEPKYIHNIAEFIANELNIPLEKLAEITNENIATIFDKIS